MATLILPADVSWSEGSEPAPPLPRRPPALVPDEVIESTALAAGLGVPASRAGTAAEFAAQLGKALAEPGPHLIEAMLTAS